MGALTTGSLRQWKLLCSTIPCRLIYVMFKRVEHNILQTKEFRRNMTLSQRLLTKCHSLSRVYHVIYNDLYFVFDTDNIVHRVTCITQCTCQDTCISTRYPVIVLCITLHRITQTVIVLCITLHRITQTDFKIVVRHSITHHDNKTLIFLGALITRHRLTLKISTFALEPCTNTDNYKKP